LLATSVNYSYLGFSDPFSSLSHLLAAAVFAVLGVLLVRRGCGSRSRQIFLGVFVFSNVFLFSMSGVYHLLTPGSGGRAVLERLDHSAIFVLIVGTFTAIQGILYRGIERWVPLLLIWVAAITGITLKTIFFVDVPEWLGLTLYLGLGWIQAFSAGVLWYRYGGAFLKPVLAGALAYTIGGLLEYLGWPTFVPGVIGPHELFHVAVLVGAACFWAFVYRIADGSVPVPSAKSPQPEQVPDSECLPTSPCSSVLPSES
jgi:channel protein (hemolysin III family)